jgi:hypothetical protein
MENHIMRSERQSKLQFDHMQGDNELNPQHIDYIIPVNDVKKQRLYSQFIACGCSFLHEIPLEVKEWPSML